MSSSKKIGLLTTFNQPCGLSAFAECFVNSYGQDNLIVLAEQLPSSQMLGPEKANVRRVWQRSSGDYRSLSSCIRREGLSLLQINCQYSFFQMPDFSSCLAELRDQGLKVVTVVHNTYTISDNLQQLCRQSDRVVVHTEENLLELVANDVAANKVQVIEMPAPSGQVLERLPARAALGIESTSPVIVTFGFIQPHKGIEEIISAAKQLTGEFPGFCLYIVGGVHAEDPNSGAYLSFLKQSVKDLGLGAAVRFVEGYVDEKTVDQYLAAADGIVLNYRSGHYEASAVACRALASGNPVITSSAPCFVNLRSAVFHTTSGFPLWLAIQRVLRSTSFKAELRQRAKAWCREHSWKNVALAYHKLHDDLLNHRAGAELSGDGLTKLDSCFNRKKRVLFWTRPNALSQRGGDTSVLENYAARLLKNGFEVTIDLEGKQLPTQFDLVHLFNFATPEITEHYARRCESVGVPFVVSTLYEDRPSFFSQMNAFSQALAGYVVEGQVPGKWKALREEALRAKPITRWENGWAAVRAARLLATGESEKKTLLQDYPGSRVEVCQMGCDLASENDGGARFQREFNIRDFVLCVGRLESRKNQLMLLKALEDSELPLVFATSGFTYQPDYEEICRRFVRRGPTVFLGRLDETLLASAYQACRVHALPSWYELPGLVSLEAARYGKNVVVSDLGTARDYLGEKGFYCQPDDPQSIYQAVLAAFYAPANEGLQAQVSQFSWDRAVEHLATVYQAVLTEVGGRVVSNGSVSDASYAQEISKIKKTSKTVFLEGEKLAQVSFQSSVGVASAEAIKLCEQADALLESGQNLGVEELYLKAQRSAPRWARPLRAMGVVALQGRCYAEAESWFNKALTCEDTDYKSWIGRALAATNLEQPEKAWDCFVRAHELRPDEISYLTQMISVAYALKKYQELEEILKEIIERIEFDPSVQYCLAGLYFKQGRFEQSKKIVDLILCRDPRYTNAVELREMLVSAVLVAQETEQKGLVIRERVTLDLGAKISWDDLLVGLESDRKDRKLDRVISQGLEILAQGSLPADKEMLVRVLVGESYVFEGRLPEARQMLTIVATSKFQRDRALAALGTVDLLEQKLALAKDQFAMALICNGNNDTAHAGMGHCYLQEGQQDDAWTSFKKASELNPENMRALLGVIELGYARKDLVIVESAIRRYLELHSADVNFIYSLAGCLYAQGRIKEAKGHLDTALMFDPAHVNALELMSRLNSELSGYTG